VTITIDAVRAMSLLRLVVAEKGEDHIAPVSCRYSTDDVQPSCIVAHALHRAGVTTEELAGLDEQTTNFGGVPAIEEVRLPDRVHVTAGALAVLGVAQTDQDNGRMWGHALAEARECLRRIDAEAVGS
jgi:hypothetical protein